MYDAAVSVVPTTPVEPSMARVSYKGSIEAEPRNVMTVRDTIVGFCTNSSMFSRKKYVPSSSVLEYDSGDMSLPRISAIESAPTLAPMSRKYGSLKSTLARRTMTLVVVFWSSVGETEPSNWPSTEMCSIRPKANVS